jgi:protein-arginine kinase activator protein McsA
MTSPARREVRKTKRCQRCNQNVSALLVRRISASGVSMVYWQCPDCQDAIDKAPHWIKHDQLTTAKIDPETLPVAGDYRQQHACAVCGSVGTEYHHFAPKHLFGDEADLWPTAYLCLRHHHQWHTLVTPEMSRRRKD